MTLKKYHIEKLCVTSVRAIAVIDAAMQLSSTEERVKRIAQAIMALEMGTDIALHFGLGLSFKQIANKKKKWTAKP